MMDTVDRLTCEEIVEVCSNRSSYYRFLASIYKLELTDTQIEKMAHLIPPVGEADGGYTRIAEYLRHRDTGTRTELAVDYAHTFLGSGEYAEVMAPPYESVYTSKEHLLMQEARDRAVASYRSQGLGLSPGNTTPEDHVSFEFEFMAELSDRCAVAMKADDAACAHGLLVAQQLFYTEHLANWIHVFCESIRTHARTDFYKGVADITETFVVLEAETLDDLLAINIAA